MSGLRKWLGGSFTVQARRGELLAIVLLGIIIGLIWPGIPTWVFLLGGFTAGISQRAVRDVRCWLRRRRTA